MRAWGRLICLACALWTLAVPATAAAKPGFVVEERALKLRIAPPASNGYVIRIATEGHRQVTLTARRKGSGTVKYTTTGRVSRHGIEAEFADLGRVSVRFEGEQRRFSGPLPPRLEAQLPDLDFLHRECHGRKPVREVGSFRGTIRFEGEKGFTRVAAHRAPGEVKRFYTRVCEGGLGSLPGGLKGIGGPRLSALFAVDRAPGRRASLEAVQIDLGRFGPIAFVSARLVERRRTLRIERSATDFGEDGSVLLSPPGTSPTTATVALTAPFSGTADYRREPGSPATWVGSLAARLPGAGLVPLTGPGFEATVCRFPLEDIFSSRCLRRIGVPLPAPLVTAPPLAARLDRRAGRSTQGSGSQSQLLGDARLSWSR